MINLIKNALANIKAHKLRVFIAIIWIVIGITSVIVISSIGKGVEQKIEQSINKVINKKFTVTYESHEMMSYEYIKPFSVKDIEELTFIEGISKIGKNDEDLNNEDFWSNIISADIKYDGKESWIDITKTEFDDKNKSKYDIIYGRNFAIEDMNRRVIILTFDSATELFKNPKNAIGKGVTINGNVYEVIGVAKSKMDDMYDEEVNFLDELNNVFQSLEDPYSMDNYWYLTCLIPESKFEEIKSSYVIFDDIYSLNISLAAGYDFYDVSNRVVEKLQELHPDLEGTYTISDPSEMMQETEYIKEALNKFIKIIILISLFVGGIGILNFQYVSVIERTREIGIRRAIGARPINIMFQFLIESAFITLVGGLIGVIVGILVATSLSTYLPFKIIIDTSTLVISLLSSILTGIIFGVVPAFKASRLDPIKAISK